MSYQFEKIKAVDCSIKVIGVGGGGCNAVNHLQERGINSVELYVCNTDLQCLDNSSISNKIQLGKELTRGLGAGTDPQVGYKAAEESKKEIEEMLKNTDMVFITAGMGGGTGTGAAPFIAKISKEMDILTVGIVTQPFVFEGKPKDRRAKEGIKNLQKYCDTIIIILNENVKEVFKGLNFENAFQETDNILAMASKSIAEIITVHNTWNVDFADVRTALKNSGVAIMGTGISKGDRRTLDAAEKAIGSPLLNNASVYGAKYILLIITTSDFSSFKMEEFEAVTSYVREQAGGDDNEEMEVITGINKDESLEDHVAITIVATNFGSNTERSNKDLSSKQTGENIKKIVEDQKKDFFNEIRKIDKNKEKNNQFNLSKKLHTSNREEITNSLVGVYKVKDEGRQDEEKSSQPDEIPRTPAMPISQYSEEEIRKIQQIPTHERKKRNICIKTSSPKLKNSREEGLTPNNCFDMNID